LTAALLKRLCPADSAPVFVAVNGDVNEPIFNDGDTIRYEKIGGSADIIDGKFYLLYCKGKRTWIGVRRAFKSGNPSGDLILCPGNSKYPRMTLPTQYILAIYAVRLVINGCRPVDPEAPSNFLNGRKRLTYAEAHHEGHYNVDMSQSQIVTFSPIVTADGELTADALKKFPALRNEQANHVPTRSRAVTTRITGKKKAA
jgi:hypothetical protein